MLRVKLTFKTFCKEFGFVCVNDQFSVFTQNFKCSSLVGNVSSKHHILSPKQGCQTGRTISAVNLSTKTSKGTDHADAIDPRTENKQVDEEDFFGIQPDNKLNISSENETKKVDLEKMGERFSFLDNHHKYKEIFVQAPYGLVRFDKEDLTKSFASDHASTLSQVISGRAGEHTECEQKKKLRRRLRPEERIELLKTCLSKKNLLHDKEFQSFNSSNSALGSFDRSQQLSPGNKSNRDDRRESDSYNEFDLQYFGDHLNEPISEKPVQGSYGSLHKVDLKSLKDEKVHANKQDVSSQKDECTKYYEFDQQYLGDQLEPDMHSYIKYDNISEQQSLEIVVTNNLREVPKNKNDTSKVEPAFTNVEYNEFDKQYFPDQTVGHGVEYNTNHEHHEAEAERIGAMSMSHPDKSGSKVDKEKTKDHFGNSEYLQQNQQTESQILSHLKPGTHVIGDTVIHKVKTKKQERAKNTVIPNTEDPVTAYDYAMKLRKEGKMKSADQGDSQKYEKGPTEDKHKTFKGKWSGKVDSKGFKVLTGQVPDFTYVQEDVVTQILRDSILYDAEGIVAIDKPYGLPSHGGPGVHHSVGKLLPKLAKLVDHNLDTLHLIHRLDKETTGIMLLARNEEVASRVHHMFIKREVVKRYWVLTKGVPYPLQGVIDIPMAEGTVQGKYRMTLRPHRSAVKQLGEDVEDSEKWSEAVTKYTVLDENNSCALVECEPATGVKHQIRCHLAFGLNTPILGDHKYSHFSKLAPQKLPYEALHRLGIRQSKVRHLPMHLHAKSIVLPGYLDGRNLFISTRLPSHFVQNMKWLKISPPKGR